LANPVTLESGANVSLTAGNPLLKEVVVGFGWDVINSNSGDVELVPSALLCDSDGKVISDEHMVFFNQLSTPDDSVRYVTKDDKEQIELDLSKIPSAVEKIVFIVFVDPDVRKPGNFGSVRNARIRVADREDSDIARYDITQADKNVTAMVFGEIYRYKDAWKFRAVGQGYSTGLVGVARDYKVNL